MGDFNAKHAHWKCPDTNSRGNILLDHMLENDYIIHYTPNPTLVHYNSNYQPTTPDLVLSQNVHDICDIRTLPALSSNHLPVAFSVVGNFTRKSLEYFRYCDADWTGFRSHVNDNITLSSNFFSSISEIDNALNSFMELLLEARSKFVPTGKLNNHNKTLPREIKQTIKIKNRVRRLMLKEDNQNVRSSLRTTFNSLNHNIRRGIRELQDKIWNKKLSKVDNPSSDLWRLAKSIRSKPIIIPPLAKPDGTKTKSTKDQCEILADAFHENMSLTLNWQSDNENTVAASLETINCFQPYRIYKPTRPREIWSIIRKLKLRKAPGYDGIHNALLKNLPQKAVILLTKILNACLRISYFPQAWKLAKVIAILKSGKDACLGTSYRPISLLSSLSKLFESVIYKRLIATTHHLLRNEQFGFRKSHSTTQQLARVAEHVAHHLNLGQSTGMFLLDIEKAFDTVWHDGLLHKLVINQVICVGDKSRAILQRLYSKHIVAVANEIGRLPPTFTDASKLATAILTCGYDFGSGKIIYNKFRSVVSYQQSDMPLFSQKAVEIIYNKFRSVVSYQQSDMPLFSQKAVENAPKLTVYDSLDSDVIQSYMEFSLASMLFYALKEGACSEQSSRMTAMDNASKNAGEMIEKLTLTFNRTRQAVITRELIEIISGAAALE
ncbi:unnamed protein product [Plutella xylostella]|uniref:F-ATPase gamma subunit n=6 Tax=Arthropoda TaxID=6656 RepID=A0A8S4G6A8_PLUXY|nr:unnamed protein product [Plutella xylostella]